MFTLFLITNFSGKLYLKIEMNSVRYVDVTKRTTLERDLRVFLRDHDVPRFDRSLFSRI